MEVFHRDDYYGSIIASEACKKSDQFPGKTGECLSFEILPEGSGNGEEIPENEFLDNRRNPFLHPMIYPNPVPALSSRPSLRNALSINSSPMLYDTCSPIRPTLDGQGFSQPGNQMI